MLENWLLGIGQLGQWQVVLAMFAGVAMGIVVGAMPGLSGPTGLALMIPFTYILSPIVAIVLLISIFETKFLLLTAPLIVVIFHKYNLSKNISFISIFFAKISYPLYLIHIPLFLLVSPFLISYGPLLCFLLSCFLSIIVAYFLYELIDKRYKSINLIISKKLKLNNGF